MQELLADGHEIVELPLKVAEGRVVLVNLTFLVESAPKIDLIQVSSDLLRQDFQKVGMETYLHRVCNT